MVASSFQQMIYAVYRIRGGRVNARFAPRLQKGGPSAGKGHTIERMPEGKAAGPLPPRRRFCAISTLFRFIPPALSAVDRKEGDAMRQIEWQDRFNIGVDIVDQAHQRLFAIVQKIMDLYIEKHEDKFACVEGRCV